MRELVNEHAMRLQLLREMHDLRAGVLADVNEGNLAHPDGTGLQRHACRHTLLSSGAVGS
jgi:hypothetical protein